MRERQWKARRKDGWGGLIPGGEWFWRVALSILLGLVALATVVPWAQAQRSAPAMGGEYLLVLTALVLPLVCFHAR